MLGAVPRVFSSTLRDWILRPWVVFGQVQQVAPENNECGPPTRLKKFAAASEARHLRRQATQHYTPIRFTRIPSLRALSTIFSVIPDPGVAIKP